MFSFDRRLECFGNRPSVKVKCILLSKMQYIRLGARDYCQLVTVPYIERSFGKSHTRNICLAHAVRTVRKVCICLAVYTASQPSGPESSATPRF